MPLANNMTKMAIKILSREGSTMSLHFQDMAGTYDPETGTNTTNSDVVIPVKVVQLDYDNVGQQLTTKTGITIESNSKQFYISPQGTSLEVFPRSPSPASDFLIDAEGNHWGIKAVKAYKPDGINAIMYDCLVAS